MMVPKMSFRVESMDWIWVRDRSWGSLVEKLRARLMSSDFYFCSLGGKAGLGSGLDFSSFLDMIRRRTSWTRPIFCGSFRVRLVL